MEVCHHIILSYTTKESIAFINENRYLLSVENGRVKSTVCDCIKGFARHRSNLFHFAPQQNLDCNTAQLGHNILKFPSQT